MIVEQAANEYARAERAGVRLLKSREIDLDQWAMTDALRANIRPASDWVQAVVDYYSIPASEIGATLPWGVTHTRVRLRPGELSIWAGVNGHGKSMLLSQVVLDLAIRQGESTCIASLEMRPISTLARMTRQALADDTPGPRDIREFHQRIGNTIWLYDQQGTIRHDHMLAMLRYCREELNLQHVVIDSLMKCGINGDDYNVQKRFVDALSTYARDSGVHVHLVCHARKRDTEDKPIDKFDIKGASEITDMADNVFSVWRNKPKEAKIERGDADDKTRSEPDAVLQCDKQRNGEWEGRIALWFHPRTYQYTANNTTQSIDYMRDAQR